MLLFNYDLYDFYAVMLYFRMYPEDPINKEILPALQELIDTPQIGNGLDDNSLRRALQHIDFSTREFFRWVKTENVYTAHTHIIKEPTYYSILSEALNEFSLCLEQNNPERFSDLADAMHNIPTIMTDQKAPRRKKRAMRFQCSFYRKKWNRNFLKQYL